MKARYTRPRTIQVSTTPVDVGVANRLMRKSDRGEPMSAPPPKPMMAMPVAIPRRSGNQAISVETGVMYPMPRPHPPRTPYPR
jgi:hypothetical protein